MTLAIAFVMGLIGGWVIEWLIDFFFWRRSTPVEKELAEVRGKLAAAEARNEAYRQEIAGRAAPMAVAAEMAGDSASADAWQGEYFNNLDLSGEPALVRADTAIDFYWGTNPPAPEIVSDGFSVRWTRRLDLDPGRYRFTARADDGVRLWVGDQLLIDAWFDHPAHPYSGEIDVAGGPAPLRLEYYDRTLEASVQLHWAPVTAVPCPQDLSTVGGLGPEDVARLAKAGIATYWDLGTMSLETLAGILQMSEVEEPHLARVQDAALAVAEGEGRTGQVWDGTPADDFAWLEGMTAEARVQLHAAGICTAAQLAETPVARLAQILPMPEEGETASWASWPQAAAATLPSAGAMPTTDLEQMQESALAAGDLDEVPASSPFEGGDLAEGPAPFPAEGEG
jgi:predicted flap endonuclease-1-like 5' DNA nuclease